MVIDVANIIALTVSAKIGMTVRHNPELTGQDTAPKPPVFPASKTDGIPPVLLPRIRCSERSWFRNDRLNNGPAVCRWEEQKCELKSLMRISYSVFCLKK